MRWLLWSWMSLMASWAFAQRAPLPELVAQRMATATNPAVDTNASFSLGLTTDGGQRWQDSATSDDLVEVVGRVRPEAAQVGRRADVFLLDLIGNQFLMFTNTGGVLPWDGQLATLVPYRAGVTLAAELNVDIYRGRVGSEGVHRLFLGYRTDDGVLIYTPTPKALTFTSSGTASDWQPTAAGLRQHKFLNTTCSTSSDGKLTAKITDTETLDGIVPPGVAAGWEIKPHSYLRIKGERAAIYAPTDMALVQGAFYKEPPSFQAKTTYILHFAIGCEFAMYLDHITDPVDKIKAALNSTPNEDTRMETFLSKAVSFKAGELIGYTIGAGPAGSVRLWDFGYYSSAVTNQYVNQERRLRTYAWKQLHAVCGYDYFSEPLKSTYASLFATHRGVIVPGAPCRSPNQDVAGTLAGSWFFKPDAEAVEPHVALMGDLDGKSVIVAGLPQGYIGISGSNPTAKNPAAVSSQHCYDSENGRYLYFVLVDRVTLDLYEGSGSCPASPSGTKTRLYR